MRDFGRIISHESRVLLDVKLIAVPQSLSLYPEISVNAQPGVSSHPDGHEFL